MVGNTPGFIFQRNNCLHLENIVMDTKRHSPILRRMPYMKMECCYLLFLWRRRRSVFCTSNSASITSPEIKRNIVLHTSIPTGFLDGLYFTLLCVILQSFNYII